MQCVLTALRRLSISPRTPSVDTIAQQITHFCRLMRKMSQRTSCDQQELRHVVTKMRNELNWLNVFMHTKDLHFDVRAVLGVTPSGRIGPTGEFEPVVITHIGNHSINVTGVFTKDVADIHPMATIDTQLMGFLFDIINKFPASVRFDEVNNSFEVSSDIAISGNAFGFQDKLHANIQTFF